MTTICTCKFLVIFFNHNTHFVKLGYTLTIIFTLKSFQPNCNQHSFPRKHKQVNYVRKPNYNQTTRGMTFVVNGAIISTTLRNL